VAGRSGRRARFLAAFATVGLTGTLAGGATAGPVLLPPAPAPTLAALPAGSVETPGRNELVSTPQASGGAVGATAAAQVDAFFAAPTISANGRYVVFLQEGGRKAGNQVALRDRRERTTRVLGESDANGPLRQPTISGNGAWVAYVRPGDGSSAIVLVDTRTGERLLAPTPPGRYRFPDQPALSEDGLLLAIRTRAVEGTEILLLDRTSGEAAWETISLDVAGRPTGFTAARAAQPAIAGSGRYVAFTAAASFAQLVDQPKASNDFRQVFLRDRRAGTTTMLSVTPAGTLGLGHSLTPAISANERVVAFATAAADLVAGDDDEQVDVVAWTRGSPELDLVSRSSAGGAGNGASAFPAVNDDGSQVAFASAATTLVPGDTTTGPAGTVDAPTTGLAAVSRVLIAGDIFVRTRDAGRTTRVSVARGNAAEANGFSTYPSISATGRFVAFTSVATNLVAGDANDQAPDVFVRERPPRLAVAPNPVDFGSAPLGSLGTSRPVTIRSTGITPARIGEVTRGGAHPDDFLVVDNPCTGRSLAPGQTCELQVVFVGTATGNRTATLAVAGNAGAPVVVRLLGAVGIPKLTLEPKRGPPGIVAIATGTGFPPNAPITLRWSVGITPTPLAPIVSDGTGGFTAQVLVLPRDRLGRRVLRAVASVPGLAPEPASAPFVVVTPTGQPPTSGLVQVFAARHEAPIILRR
jgi:Tol biopolymer transport system component